MLVHHIRQNLGQHPKLVLVQVCVPAHSEAKQIETLEFGAEEGLLQGPIRRRVVHALKSP